MFFTSRYSSKFLYHVISFQPEEIPPVLLLRQVWYLWFLLALVYLKKTLFHLHSKKSKHRIWNSGLKIFLFSPAHNSIAFCRLLFLIENQYQIITTICKACPFSLLFLEIFFLTFFNDLTTTYLYVIHLVFFFIEVQGSWICTLMFINNFEMF